MNQDMAFKTEEINSVTTPSDENVKTPIIQSPDESDSCLITPNIYINHLFVYNLSPGLGSSFDTTIVDIPSKYQSPACSSGPICRICHEGDDTEDLVSPCRCTGTVGLVHKVCMERWLSSRVNVIDKCEICNYPFVTARTPKSFSDFMRSDENNAIHRRSFMGDLTCFVLLSPLSIVSSFLCIEGAKKQVGWGNSLEAGSLMALATFLMTTYVMWIVLTLRFHLKIYFKWRLKNHNVKLLKVQRISTASDGPNQTCIQVITHDSNNNVVIPMAEQTVNMNGSSPSIHTHIEVVTHVSNNNVVKPTGESTVNTNRSNHAPIHVATRDFNNNEV